MNEWINVADSLPKFGEEVLIFEDDYISIGEYCDYSNIDEPHSWIKRDYGHCNPTHWMPLPYYPDKK